MPYSDKEKQRQYQREWQRNKRAAEVKPSHGRTLNLDEIRTARGLLQELANTLGEVNEAKGDIFMKARLKGYLIAIGLKAVEVADLEARIARLEEGYTINH